MLFNISHWGCFSKFTTYEQNIHRYHKLKTIPVGKLPAELDFLVKIYSGWNKPTLSQEEFYEIQKKVQNFPANSLRKIKGKLNLTDLWQELSKLDMNQTFLHILAKKYKLTHPNASQIQPNSEPAVKIQ